MRITSTSFFFLLHASKTDHGSSAAPPPKPVTHMPNQHIVSSVAKPGIYGSLTTNWILDTSASDQVCPNITYFSTYKSMTPIHVTLPNGSIVTAYYSSSIVLSDHISLQDVLHIPDFHYNLISIHRLTLSLNCHLIFSSFS